MTGDVKADYPFPKGLIQHLGIGRVVAEIGDNEGIAVVTRVNRRQRVCPRISREILRKLLDVANSEQAWTVGTIAAIAVERSWLRPTSWAMMSGLNAGQLLTS
jgi:hypothetical protein